MGSRRLLARGRSRSSRLGRGRPRVREARRRFRDRELYGSRNPRGSGRDSRERDGRGRRLARRGIRESRLPSRASETYGPKRRLERAAFFYHPGLILHGPGRLR